MVCLEEETGRAPSRVDQELCPSVLETLTRILLSMMNRFGTKNDPGRASLETTGETDGRRAIVEAHSKGRASREGDQDK